MSNDLNITELRAVDTAATSGPWNVSIREAADGYALTITVGAGTYISSGGASWTEPDLILEKDVEHLDPGPELEQVEANAEFIAKSRTAFPKLLDRLEKLAADLTQIDDLHIEDWGKCETCTDDKNDNLPYPCPTKKAIDLVRSNQL